jgi:hypothetical protein
MFSGSLLGLGLTMHSAVWFFHMRRRVRTFGIVCGCLLLKIDSNSGPKIHSASYIFVCHISIITIH